ncbi:TVP38/TMEM64 family protein [Paenibacillus sp. WQ 127069]|uniref:TVP38/TMEM64 family membrane protein n=1 Tax=Paenibacillus baimaensis TaxID=2982185 RepID=A0ABT2ULR7_9BACL|nr:TVP38/TMEM64 family protein [Paenibacillus sp. WQ 127069]MCU6795587.1 TVP38/TMEM64 family protein [Paenibacillus sp. WQ 127069]
MTQQKKNKLLKIILLLLAIVLIFLFIRYAPAIFEILSSMDNFRDFIRSSGNWGPVLFIFFQILQVVVAPIPGEVVQIAGGYIYGVSLGTLYATIGMLLGAAIAFYFTRFIGRSWIERLLENKKYKWMSVLKNEKKLSVFLFIFFLIPGLPKDLLVFVAALTPIGSLRFFTLLLVGRLPWIVASVVVGTTIHQEQYGVAVIITLISIVAFMIGYFYKNKWIELFSKSEKKEEKS